MTTPTSEQSRRERELEDVLIRHGFVRCDIPACNCGKQIAEVFAEDERCQHCGGCGELFQHDGRSAGQCPHCTEPPTPSALPAQAVAYLVSGLPSGEPSLCFEDERGDYGGDDHTLVFEPLVRAAQPVAQPGKVPTPRYAREMEAVGQAVNRAARDLLGDARIRIDLEGGAGTVYWLDKKKGAWRHIDTGDLFSEQINAAVDAAMKE